MTPIRGRAAAVGALVVLIFTKGWAFDVLAQSRFVFAGLSLRTTIDEARKRYPKSSISNFHVYVAESDSHDHVYAVDIPAGDRDRRLRVWFERQGPRAPIYPPCDQVRGVLEKQYGNPTTVQEYDEERARNRRFIWRQREEELSLLCFRLGRQPFSASDLTIAVRDTVAP